MSTMGAAEHAALRGWFWLPAISLSGPSLSSFCQGFRVAAAAHEQLAAKECMLSAVEGRIILLGCYHVTTVG
jgi:hypothetical protein